MKGSISSSSAEFLYDIVELLSSGMSRGMISVELKIPEYKVDDAIEDHISPALAAMLGQDLFAEDTFSMGDAVMGKMIYRILSPDYSEDKYKVFLDALGAVKSEDYPSQTAEDDLLLDADINEVAEINEPLNCNTELDSSEHLRNPLEMLNNKQITMGGLRVIRNDPALKPDTIEKLKTTEATLLKQKYSKYEKLIYGHDAFPVYYDNFRKYEYMGKTSLALTVMERPLLSYSDLAAYYAYERDMPFIAAVLILEDLKSVEGGFFLLQRDKKEHYMKYAEWKPNTKFCSRPPVNYAKLYRSGYESAPGAGDRYTVKAYLESGCVMSTTAKALGITRPTVAKRLKECGINDSETRSAESLETWIAERKSKSTVKTDGLSSSLPRVKESLSTSNKGLEILLFYYTNEMDIRKTAERYNTSKEDMMRYIEKLKGKKGITLLAVAAADIAFNGDSKKASEALELTERWFIRKRSIAHKQYGKEILRQAI